MPQSNIGRCKRAESRLPISYYNSIARQKSIDFITIIRTVRTMKVDEDLNEDMPLNKIVEHTCKVCGCTQAKLMEVLTDGLNESRKKEKDVNN